MRRRQVVRGLVPAFALWLAFPHPLHAHGTTLVPVAEAYTAAWNAHDLPAVLALFAPDAVVRERRGDVPPHVWDTHDPQVVATYLEDSHDGATYDTHGLTWVTGRQPIAAWAAARFAWNHRYAVGQPRAAGATVGWPYREYADPFQLLVRRVGASWIPFTERRGTERQDLWVNGLPGGESPRGQEHAVEAGAARRRLRPGPARPARHGESWIA
jgi:hypothetical protein